MKPQDPWIRLAQANIILGQNENACRLLITASDYEPWLWQVWRDLTTVSAKCSDFARAASSYQNALRLNPSYGNEEILKRIVSSLVNENLDETYHARVRKAACQLLEELTRLFPRNSHFWCLLGVVLASERVPAKCVRSLAIQKLTRAIELIQSPLNKWYIYDSQIMPVLEASQLIVDCLVNVGHLLRGTKEGSDSLKMATTHIDYVTSKLEEFHSDFLSRSVRHVYLNQYNLLKFKSQKIKALPGSCEYFNSISRILTSGQQFS